MQSDLHRSEGAGEPVPRLGRFAMSGPMDGAPEATSIMEAGPALSKGIAIMAKPFDHSADPEGVRMTRTPFAPFPICGIVSHHVV